MNSLKYVFFLCVALIPTPLWATTIDSYRFLHVSIDTPWWIFVFLFFLVFAPMVLMAVLYWKYSLSGKGKKDS